MAIINNDNFLINIEIELKNKYIPGISTDGLFTHGEDGSDNPPEGWYSSDDPLANRPLSTPWLGTVNGICRILQGKRINEW